MHKMELNDNKAGMQGLDKQRINAIIEEASKGSKFYQHQQQKDEKMKARIENQRRLLESLTPAQLERAEKEMDAIAKDLEETRDLSQIIVHIDMDAYYAAVEMRDNPSLRNVPMAVGGNHMLSTSNYPARRFGVRAAMPGFIAKKLCPELIIVSCNFDKYIATAEEIREIFADYDPNFSPMSLDEAYLNITNYVNTRSGAPVRHKRKRFAGDCNCMMPRFDGNVIGGEAEEFDRTEIICEKCHKRQVILNDIVEFGHTAEEVIKELRFRIEQKTGGLTASAGIACNTRLAKICSDRNKPNGQFYLPPDRNKVIEFVRELPVRKIPGIGGVSEQMLKAIGVTTCKDLWEERGKLKLLYMQTSWMHFLRVSLGIGDSMMSWKDEPRKSISVERTFNEKSNPDELIAMCRKLSESLAEDVAEKGLKGKTVTLKYKTVEFDTRTRAQTVTNDVATFEQIFAIAKDLLDTELAKNGGRLRLRLMGVRLSSLEDPNSPTKRNVAECESLLKFVKTKQEPSIATTAKRSSSSPKKAEEPAQESFFRRKMAEFQMQKQQQRTKFEEQNHKKNKSEDEIREPTETTMPVKRLRTVSISKTDSTNDEIDIPTEKRLQTEHFANNSPALRDAEEPKPGEYCRNSRYLCPVCRWTIKCDNLEAFNAHLDACLSKQAIGEVLREEMTKKVDAESSKTAVKLKAKKLKKSGENIKHDIKASNVKGTRSLEKFFVTK